MNSNESDLIFTGQESDKKYHTVWSSEGIVNTVTVTDRVTGRVATAKNKTSLIKLQRKLIEALEK